MKKKLPKTLESIAIAKAKAKEVLALVVAEALLLEHKKAEAREEAKARGLTDAEIDVLIPPHPAGAFSL